jgi:hypothetical protein
MEDKISLSKIEKYRKITSEALSLAKKNIVKGKEKEANEIVEIVECYLSDSSHFQKKGNLVDCYGCLNYAHGWLDCGARLKIFYVKDSRLFTV